MKTAISIPDPIFKSAEKLAHRLGMSRSELYVKALSKFIQEKRSDKVTERLNKVYSEHDDSLDPVLQKLQYDSLSKGDWN